MPPRNSSQRQVFPISIDGGYNTEAGPSCGFRVRDGNVVSIPWLVNAENVTLNLDGWPQKMPGASNVNTTTTGATDSVMGIFDYWKANTSGSPTQQIIVVSGTQIYRVSGASLVSIGSGFVADAMPAFEIMNDNLIITTTSTVDVPQTYDQTSLTALGGSPPNFDFCRFHKRRMWAAGVASAKSRLYYSIQDSAADWSGAGSGSIDINADDGDVITGLASHKNELIVFKGPYRNAIYRITGSTPSDFAVVPFARGVGASNHQAILNVSDDLWFWDDNGIHSLAATAAYGDFKEEFLSRDIASYFTKLLNHSRFGFVSGANFAGAGYAIWTVSRSGSSTNNMIVMLDYRFTPPRFTLWPAYSVASVAMVNDASRETVPWCGTYTGFARRMNRAARDLGGTAYTYKVTFPYVSFGDPFYDKTAAVGRISVAPKGDTSFTIGYQRDTNTQQTESGSQGGVATLGVSSDQFTLDSLTSGRLGGGSHRPVFFPLTGTFKEIQFELTQGGLDVDFEPHGMSLAIEPSGVGETLTLA